MLGKQKGGLCFVCFVVLFWTNIPTLNSDMLRKIFSHKRHQQQQQQQQACNSKQGRKPQHHNNNDNNDDDDNGVAVVGDRIEDLDNFHNNGDGDGDGDVILVEDDGALPSTKRPLMLSSKADGASVQRHNVPAQQPPPSPDLVIVLDDDSQNDIHNKMDNTNDDGNDNNDDDGDNGDTESDDGGNDDDIVNVHPGGDEDEEVQPQQMQLKQPKKKTSVLGLLGMPDDYGVSLYAKNLSKLQQEHDDSEKHHRQQQPTSTTSQPQSNVATKSSKPSIREKRLRKELKVLRSCTSVTNGVFSFDFHRGNESEWDVKLYKFDADSLLAKDLAILKTKYGIDNIWIRVKIPEEFPFSPPIVRLIAPYVHGGFVMSGGAICLELLTGDGWSQAYRMESVFLEIVSAISKGSRIVKKLNRPLNPQEAKRAFEHLEKVHKKYGWKDTKG